MSTSHRCSSQHGVLALLPSADTMSSSRAISALDLVRQLWKQAELPACVLENTLRRGNLVLVNDAKEAGQAIQSSFQLTAVAQACCAAIALAERLRCALIHLEHAGGSEKEVDRLVLERVEVDAAHALAEYKGWTKLYMGQSHHKQEMLESSISTDSNLAKKALKIDPHAVADWDALAGLYRTRPSKNRSVPAMVRIHTNFPHHKLGILQLLNLAPPTAKWNDEGVHESIFSRVSRSALQNELETWDAFDFEQAAQQRGLCVTAYRSRDEWETSEMGLALKAWMGQNVENSAFRISRLKASSSPNTKQARPNQEILKVIDMSRVIAGPICTRTLAAYGADVLLLSSRHLPNLPLRELDTARGKRAAFVDLPRLEGNAEVGEAMKKLLEGADVFSQAYRPRGLAERGLSAEAVQRIRPGIVYAELCAFGFTGPWKDRRAYDSLTQTACGINHLEGLSYQQHHGTAKEMVAPKALPVQALDYAAGSLMCFAILACKCRALLERIMGNKGVAAEEAEEEEEGWKVQVSLASTAEWIMSLGQIHGDDAWVKPPEEVIPVDDADRLAKMVSSYEVRGLPSHATDGTDEAVNVLAIRHATIPAHDAQGETPSSTQRDGLQWTVPAHLGVDKLEWL